MYPGIPKHSQVIERALAEVALFVAVDRFTRRAELFGLARFDFDKHEPVLVAGDNIDLSFAATEVLQEDLIVTSTEVSRGSLFAARAQDLAGREVVRLFEPPKEHIHLERGE